MTIRFLSPLAALAFGAASTCLAACEPSAPCDEGLFQKGDLCYPLPSQTGTGGSGDAGGAGSSGGAGGAGSSGDAGGSSGSGVASGSGGSSGSSGSSGAGDAGDAGGSGGSGGPSTSGAGGTGEAGGATGRTYFGVACEAGDPSDGALSAPLCAAPTCSIAGRANARAARRTRAPAGLVGSASRSTTTPRPA